MSMRAKTGLLVIAGIAMAIAIASLVILALAYRASAALADKDTAIGAKTAPVSRTSWGEPDLQGIWSRDVDIPLERPAQYANQEFFTDTDRAALDQRIADIITRDSTESRRARGTERDVNTEFA